MLTYYDLLEIDNLASLSAIKRAFRKKAKQLHPDLKNNEDSAEQMRVLIKAYEVLSNPLLREEYDKKNRIRRKKYHFDYRKFLKEQADNKSHSKLIFFDLLHSHENEALELYDLLVQQKDFDLSENLDREDFMDCAFLLAEEYERRNELKKSYDLLKTIFELENEKPYFKHFIVEVTDRLKNITCNKMPGNVSNRLNLDCLKELIDLQISKKESAYFYKKSAEIYLDIGMYNHAVSCLNTSLSLDNKVNGVKKLKERIQHISSVEHV